VCVQVCVCACVCGYACVRLCVHVCVCVTGYDELVLTSVESKLAAKEERLWAAFRKFDLDGDGTL